jgi:hypothetical protein
VHDTLWFLYPCRYVALFTFSVVPQSHKIRYVGDIFVAFDFPDGFQLRLTRCPTNAWTSASVKELLAMFISDPESESDKR